MKHNKIQFLISVTLSVIFSSAIVFYFVSAQTTETSLRNEGLIVGGLQSGMPAPPEDGAVIKGTLDLNWSKLFCDPSDPDCDPNGPALIIRGVRPDRGRVGIGTQDPLYKLHVVGNIRASGLGLGSDFRDSWDSIRLLLVNRAHSVQDCLAAGGLVARYADSPNIICQFVRSSCPAGWTPYDDGDWSRTTSNTCTGRGEGCAADSCTTGSHPWSNTAQETCTYNALTSRAGVCVGSNRTTCSANIVEIGCY